MVRSRQKSISAIKFLPFLIFDLDFPASRPCEASPYCSDINSKIPDSQVSPHTPSEKSIAPFQAPLFSPRCLQHEPFDLPPPNHLPNPRNGLKQRSVRYDSHSPGHVYLSCTPCPSCFTMLSAFLPRPFLPYVPMHHFLALSHPPRHHRRADVANQRDVESNPKQNSPRPSRNSSPPFHPPPATPPPPPSVLRT
jgi:hypothetical protein